MSDDINHPTHYTQEDKPFECIELTRLCSFDLGNAIKYLWRYKDKSNPVEDLRKAIWYLNDLHNHGRMEISTDAHLYLLLLWSRVYDQDRDEAKVWDHISCGHTVQAITAIQKLIDRAKGGEDESA